MLTKPLTDKFKCIQAQVIPAGQIELSSNVFISLIDSGQFASMNPEDMSTGIKFVVSIAEFYDNLGFPEEKLVGLWDSVSSP